MKQIAFFVDEDASRAFDESFMDALASIQKAGVAQLLGNSVPQRFSHGHVWEAPPNSPSISTPMRQHSTELETRFEDLANHNLNILPETLQKLTESMHAQLAGTLYASLSEVCESTGNTVDAKAAGSLEAAFIELLERIEFSVDKDGNVKMPEIHAGSDAVAKFLEMEKSATPQFTQRVEEIKERKRQQAIEREVERKARFSTYGD